MPFLRLRAVVVAFAALAGCVSPTLPLPPPDAPSQITAGSEAGTWNVRGQCSPGAVVLIKNDATGIIAGVEDGDRDGRYLITIEAKTCDLAEVWEILGDNTTRATTFVVAPTVNGTPAGGACKL